MRSFVVALLVAFALAGFGWGNSPTQPGLYCKHPRHHDTIRVCISVPLVRA